MYLKLHSIARDKNLYDATAIYDNGIVTVKSGSKINLTSGNNFKAPPHIFKKREDKDFVDENGVVVKDVTFSSLSSAACFVTGRSANGMITWKTSDNKYVRYAIKGENDG